MIRVAVIDDHTIVRNGLVQLLGSDPELEVVGPRATARQRSRCASSTARTSC